AVVNGRERARRLDAVELFEPQRRADRNQRSIDRERAKRYELTVLGAEAPRMFDHAKARRELAAALSGDGEHAVVDELAGARGRELARERSGDLRERRAGLVVDRRGLRGRGTLLVRLGG